MDVSLQHEDLLIKLRAKLNEEKIKLWEPPYLQPENDISQSLKDLAEKYSTELNLDCEAVVQALHELQLHSVERSKANAEYKDTGLATLRLKAMVPGDKPRTLKIQKKLEVLGSELISAVAKEIGVTDNRVKLIVNGKVVKPTSSLVEQGVKNGTQIMVLVMSETPEEAEREDNLYSEMRSTRDDAALLSEYVGELDNDDEYIKLEDQSGKTVEVPVAERRALLVGLTLHERGRAAARQRDYPLALVLLLEADRQLGECSSSVLKRVDNWALLQLDIAWCYLCLQSLSSAADASARLARAEASFRNSYGENNQRLIALKGTAANEQVLIMRLYLLQGIVAYHQNKRSEARGLLDKAELELNALRVDDSAVSALMELGWSSGQARRGLRAAGGDLDRAHYYLEESRRTRQAARERHAADREQRSLGVCADGSAVDAGLVGALTGIGYPRRVAVRALQHSNNHAAEAVRIIQEHPELIADTDESSEEPESPGSGNSPVEPDNRLVAELEAMGYTQSEAAAALRATRNNITGAVELLVAGGGRVSYDYDLSKPSTSSGAPSNRKYKKRKHAKSKEEREMALHRLSSAIKTEEDDHLDTSLLEEEEFLVKYKSLL